MPLTRKGSPYKIGRKKLKLRKNNMIGGLILAIIFGVIWGIFFSGGNEERPLTKSDLEDILSGEDDSHLV